MSRFKRDTKKFLISKRDEKKKEVVKKKDSFLFTDGSEITLGINM
jgi:hypothetical protein